MVETALGKIKVWRRTGAMEEKALLQITESKLGAFSIRFRLSTEAGQGTNREP